MLNQEKNDQLNEDNYNNNLGCISIKFTLKRFDLKQGKDEIISKEEKIITIIKNLYGFIKIELKDTNTFEKYSKSNKIYYILLIQKSIIKNNLHIKCAGIKNEGNTCYINSIIQSFYNMPFLLKNIMLINIESDKSFIKENNEKAQIISSLQNIFFSLYKSSSSITIGPFLNLKKQFLNSPNDFEEIFIKIYDIISEIKNDIKNNCEGILIKDIDKIIHHSYSEEEFLFLELSVENNKSLDECLNAFLSKEIVEFGNNNYEKNGSISYKFKKIPNILFIRFKRFEYDKITNLTKKINKRITFKEDILLNDYLYNTNNNKEIMNESYSLYCIIIHSGEAKNGHYYCIIKNYKDNYYLKLNDSNIDIFGKKEIFGKLYGGKEIIKYIIEKSEKKENQYEVKKIIVNTENAYILIYVKK